MKLLALLGSLAIGLPTVRASQWGFTQKYDSTDRCPYANGSLLVSSNDIDYRIYCHTDMRTGMFDTSIAEGGLAACLAKCDRTTGCTAAIFLPGNMEHWRGYCVPGRKDRLRKAQRPYTVAVRISPPASSSKTAWPADALLTHTSDIYIKSSTSLSKSIAARDNTNPTESSAIPPSTETALPLTIFYGVVTQPNSPKQYAIITANRRNFYVGRPTSNYCPHDISCPFQTYTTFATNNHTLELNVAVPGGQHVYVYPNGALKFTLPHDTDALARNTDFGIDKDGHLQFGGKNWLACPADKVSSQIFSVAVTEYIGADTTGCLSFTFQASILGEKAVKAWAYA